MSSVAASAWRAVAMMVVILTCPFRGCQALRQRQRIPTAGFRGVARGPDPSPARRSGWWEGPLF
jgi:hypothetical protein